MKEPTLILFISAMFALVVLTVAVSVMFGSSAAPALWT